MAGLKIWSYLFWQVPPLGLRLTYLAHHIGNALNAASLSLDSWKALTDSDVLRELGVQKPLLQVSFVAN